MLYAIMRNYYNALPVVPKIYYKQNVNDYAKGADSVHIVLEPGDKFSLWLGEAKFYDSIDDTRLTSIVTSVYNTLSTDKIKKENSIIIGINELSTLDIPDNIVLDIKKLLNKDISIDKIKPLLHIPILILHECNITSKATRLEESYIKSMRDFYIDRVNSYFNKSVDKYINLTNRLLRRFYRGFSNDLENVRNSLLCVIILSNNPCQKQR